MPSAQVADPLLHQRDRGLQRRRVAPDALRVLQLVERFPIEADGDQRADPLRGR